MLEHDALKIDEMCALMHQYRRAQNTIQVAAMLVQTMTDEEVKEYVMQRHFLISQMATVIDVMEEEINMASEDYYGRRGYRRPEKI